MNVTTIRSFAAGIIVAVTISGAVYFIQPKQAASTKVEEKPQVEKLTDEEMKTQLAENGYIIHTKDEWQKQKAAIEAEAVKNTETKPEEKPSKDTNTVVYRTIITVTEGMTSIDVGRALQKVHIIDKPMEFVNTVEKKGLAQKLKPGSFEIDSDMTLDEVISIIF